MAPSLAEQVDAVRREMATRPAGLVRHVQRVLIEAFDLATRWDADPERVELAVWGHDLYRSHSPEEQLALAAEAGLKIRAQDRANPVLLHGPIAAAVLRERFGIRDREALAAVRDHTLGTAAMPLIARIMLVADKVEERKRHRNPAIALIREAAWRDLDLALLCWADWKWVDERQQRWQSDPTHWRARRAWAREHHLAIYKDRPADATHVHPAKLPKVRKWVRPKPKPKPTEA